MSTRKRLQRDPSRKWWERTTSSQAGPTVYDNKRLFGQLREGLPQLVQSPSSLPDLQLWGLWDTTKQHWEHRGEGKCPVPDPCILFFQSEFENELTESILSISPFIDFEPPYLETPKGRKCTLLGYFKQPLYRFGTEEDFDRLEELERDEIQQKAKDDVMVSCLQILCLQKDACQKHAFFQSRVSIFDRSDVL